MTHLLTIAKRTSAVLFAVLFFGSTVFAQDIHFKIRGPYYDSPTTVKYYIVAKSSLVGNTSTNMRLFLTDAQHDPSNINMTTSAWGSISNLSSTLINPPSPQNTGNFFGLPGDLIYVSANLDYYFNKANKWRRVAILTTGVYGSASNAYCSNIVFNEASDGSGYIVNTDGIESIITIPGTGTVMMNETVTHFKWMETSPTSPPFGVPTVICPDFPEKEEPSLSGLGVRIAAPMTSTEVKVYPTLFSDQLIVSNVSELQSIKIIDLNGTLMENIIPQEESGEISISTGHLQQGYYIISMINDDGTVILDQM